VTPKVAYLGPAGTFTEEAARQHNSKAILQPLPSISGVAQAVSSRIATEGIVPIENSIEGSVNDTLDVLIRQEGLFIRRELVMPIEHYLLILPNAPAGNIHVIYSHPQALAQCRGFLESSFPEASLVASLSTSAAVDDMKKSQVAAAAIAPRRAAELHNVQILSESIQDNSSNVTRFVVLANSDHPPTGSDKTSLCFSFAADEPGLLHTTIGEFAHRGLNLAKVESRPSKQSLGDYIFLIDIHGHRDDPPVKEALDAVRLQSSSLRIFGSYPRWA